MNADRRKLMRLQRLERVRAVAKLDAATRAAQAEDTFARIVALDQRTHALARRYEAQRDCGDGSRLREFAAFVSALRAMGSETARQIETARGDADARQIELAHAERRRSVVEERGQDMRKALDRRPVGQDGDVRRQSGTLLD